jgi:malate dehydrogenase (oxaloacetate-decarboxylating)
MPNSSAPDPLDAPPTRTTTAAFSITLDCRLDNVPGTLGRLCTAIGEAGGNIGALDGFDVRGPELRRCLVVHCRDEAHQQKVVDAVNALRGVTLVDWWDRTYRMHEGGKIITGPLYPVNDRDDLSMAYTPGVARVCMSIHDDPALSHRFTIRKNTVAIVSNGTAVLGLGDIGPEAALPVMEGKALLFKEFGGVDAFPVCVNARTADELVDLVARIAPTFGGINLEDVKSPECFEVEERLKASLDIPVFHDDQHGTAVVVLAALWNSLKITGKALKDLRVVIAGTGAAGVAVGKILHHAGVAEIIGCDIEGAVYSGRGELNAGTRWYAEHTNPERRMGPVGEMLRGADVFIGVSAPDIITVADVRTMAANPIVFALANPNPEIRPEQVDGLAAVMATGRSDYPNQINNVLAFPGIFRGALDVGATDITENMKLAAAVAIADSVSDDQLSPSFVVPSVFDRSVVDRVAPAVARAAVADSVIRQR